MYWVKKFFLLICFSITAVCSIFAIMASSAVNTLIGEKLKDVEESIKYNNWYIAVIVFTCVLVLLATLILLFSLSNKADYKNFLVLVFAITLVATLALACIWGYIAYDNTNLAIDQSYGDSSSSVLKTTICILANSWYCDQIVLLFVASIPNVVSSLVCIRGAENDASENVEGESVINDENEYMKAQIDQLKKQIEADNLKKEYEQVYVQVKKRQIEKEEVLKQD